MLIRTESGIFLWWCPACKSAHFADDRWTFDGNFDAPTFSPSFLVGAGADGRCHTFVRAGKIEYLSDSTHAFAGLIVAMEQIP